MRPAPNIEPPSSPRFKNCSLFSCRFCIRQQCADAPGLNKFGRASAKSPRGSGASQNAGSELPEGDIRSSILNAGLTGAKYFRRRVAASD